MHGKHLITSIYRYINYLIYILLRHITYKKLGKDIDFTILPVA
jgi:hypothetical protein